MGGVGGVGEQTNETAREKERAAPGALRRRKDRDRQTEREREREEREKRECVCVSVRARVSDESNRIEGVRARGEASAVSENPSLPASTMSLRRKWSGKVAPEEAPAAKPAPAAVREEAEPPRVAPDAFGGCGVWHWLVEAARVHGGKVGSVGVDHRGEGEAELYTYRDILRRCSALALFLRGRGVKRHSRVGVLSENCHGVLEVHFACAALQATVVNLNVNLKPVELEFILEDCGVDAVFASPELAGSLGPALDLAKTGRGVPGLVVWFGRSGKEMAGEGALRCEEVAHESCCASGDGEEAVLMAGPEREEDFEYQWYYTSGTTGRPKGVVLRHGQICMHALSTIEEMHLCDGDVWGHVSPMFHLVDAFAIYAITRVGGTHVVNQKFNAAGVLDTLERERVTCLNLASTMLTMLVHNPSAHRRDLTCLRILSCGGSPQSNSNVKKTISIFGCEFFVSYGMTECCGKISMSLLPKDRKRMNPEAQLDLICTSGRPFVSIEVKVVQDDGAEVVWDDESLGEVVVRGPTVFDGYFNTSDPRSKHFRGDWFRTGDVARVNSFGYITIADRIKDMILCGGENVYCVEVENILHAHPSVKQAAVFGTKDDIMGELVNAALVLKEGEGGSRQGSQIRSYCAERMSSYKVPTKYHFLTSMPTTSSGKIMKNRLRGMFGPEAMRETRAEALETPVWEILGLPCAFSGNSPDEHSKDSCAIIMTNETTCLERLCDVLCSSPFSTPNLVICTSRKMDDAILSMSVRAPHLQVTAVVLPSLDDLKICAGRSMPAHLGLLLTHVAEMNVRSAYVFDQMSFESMLDGLESLNKDFSLQLSTNDQQIQEMRKSLQNRIADIAVSLLDQDVGVDHQLMDCGMTSSQAVEFAVEVEGAFGLSLPSTLVFDYPTISEVSSFLEKRIGASDMQRDEGEASPANTGYALRELVFKSLEEEGGVEMGDELSGLNSSQAVSFVSKLNSVLGIDLPSTLVFDYPNVEDLIATVSSTMDVISGEKTQTLREQIPVRYDNEPMKRCYLVASHSTKDSQQQTFGDRTVDLIANIPTGRWDREWNHGDHFLPQFGYFLRDIECFDPQLFRISEPEAIEMDPQQRKLLLSWCNCHHALQIPKETAMYVGVSQLDYSILLWSIRLRNSKLATSTFTATSSHLSVVSGRLSYAFGYTGQCLSIDTACSSSLVVVNLASREMQTNKTCGAGISGVNLLIARTWSHACNSAGMLSMDGRCKVLDESADGYVRSEECASAYLTCDPEYETYAILILSSAVNQDGRSSTLTAPNGPAQQNVVLRALQESSSSSFLHRLQMHGTGTSLGDPIEIGAILAVSAQHRTHAGKPLELQCGKSLHGHSEPAAGLSALISSTDAAMGRRNKGICHLVSMNPHISQQLLSNPGYLNLSAPRGQHPQSTPNKETQGTCGVSAFAFQGTNAHVQYSAGLGTDLCCKLNLSMQSEFLWAIHGTSLRSNFRFLPQHSDAALFDCSLACANLVNVVCNGGRKSLSLFFAQGLVWSCWYELYRTVKSLHDVCLESSILLSGKAPSECVRIKVSFDGTCEVFENRKDAQWTLSSSSSISCGPQSSSRRALSCLSDEFSCVQKDTKSTLHGAVHAHDSDLFATLEQALRSSGKTGSLDPVAMKLLLAQQDQSQGKCISIYDHYDAQTCLRNSGVNVYSMSGEVLAEVNDVQYSNNLRVCTPYSQQPQSDGCLYSVALQAQACTKLASTSQKEKRITFKHNAILGLTAASGIAFMQQLYESECTASMSSAVEISAPCVSNLSQHCLTTMLIAACRVTETYPGKVTKIISTDIYHTAACKPTFHCANRRNQAQQEYFMFNRKTYFKSRLAPAKVSQNKLQQQFRGPVLITGGTGALGLLTGEHLTQHGVHRVLLLGRTGHVKGLSGHTCGAEMQVLHCDVSRAEDCHMLGGLGVQGVLHAGGVLADSVLSNQTAQSVKQVFAPKVVGLHQLADTFAMDAMGVQVLFSSVAALLGSAGQTNYAAANAVLDAQAHMWQSAGVSAVSVQWGPWASGGMAVKHAKRMEQMGLYMLTPSEGLFALQSIAGRVCGGCGCLDTMTWSSHAQVAVQRFMWDRFLSRMTHVPALFSNMQDSASLGSVLEAQSSSSKLEGHVSTMTLDADVLQQKVKEAVHAVVGHEVSPDDPLMAAGLDSLGAMELRSSLEQSLGVDLPGMLIFDYPTISSIIEYAEDCFCRDFETSSSLEEPTFANVGDDDVCVTLGNLWSSHSFRDDVGCMDVIDHVPICRWDNEVPFCLNDTFISGRFFGFLRGIEFFDKDAFSLLETEARIMDPQQRFLLSASLTSLSSWETPQKGMCGVYFGVGPNEFSSTTGAFCEQGVYTATSEAISVASGRISFTFGLQGPCMTVDTACSASLVATHLSMQGIKAFETSSSISGGALIIVKQSCQRLQKAGMLSIDGRCKTLDVTGDGYVRGEGCSLLCLEANGADKSVSVMVTGSAVNQDGRSSSLTAPNGPSQQKVIIRALQTSRRDKSSVALLQMHGTGTSLGDPIEISAANTVINGGARRDTNEEADPISFFTVKSSIGHSEVAAGVMAFAHSVASIELRKHLPFTHLRNLNPHIIDIMEHSQGHRSAKFAMQNGTINMDNEKVDNSLCGISSFAFQGTNAHLIIKFPSGGRAKSLKGRLPSLVKERCSVIPMWKRMTGSAFTDTWSTSTIQCLLSGSQLSEYMYSVPEGLLLSEWATAAFAVESANLMGKSSPMHVNAFVVTKSLKVEEQQLDSTSLVVLESTIRTKLGSMSLLAGDECVSTCGVQNICGSKRDGMANQRSLGSQLGHLNALSNVHHQSDFEKHICHPAILHASCSCMSGDYRPKSNNLVSCESMWFKTSASELTQLEFCTTKENSSLYLHSDGLLAGSLSGIQLDERRDPSVQTVGLVNTARSNNRSVSGDIVQRDANNTKEDTLQEIINIVREILQCDDVDPEETFFDAGIDSLTSLQLRATLQDKLKMQLPGTLINDYPTAMSLCEMITSSKQYNAIYLPPLYDTDCERYRQIPPCLPRWYQILMWPSKKLFEAKDGLSFPLQDGVYRVQPLRSSNGPMRYSACSTVDINVAWTRMRSTYFFRGGISDEKLIKSLSPVLDAFPTLTSRLVERSGDLYFEYGGSNAHVEVRTGFATQWTPQDYIGMVIPGIWKLSIAVWLWQFLYSNIGVALFLAWRAYTSLFGSPLMRIRITHIVKEQAEKKSFWHPLRKVGRPSPSSESDVVGTYVTVDWMHSVADGGTMGRFMSLWAMSFRNEPLLVSHPGPLNALNPKQKELFARMWLNEAPVPRLYRPLRGNGLSYMRFLVPSDTIQRVQNECSLAARTSDIVVALMWKRQREYAVLADQVAYPRITFLEDLRQHIPQLQPFSGNLIRFLPPLVPEPADGEGMAEDADVARVADLIFGHRKKEHFTMAQLEDTGSLPGIPCCWSALHEMISQEGCPMIMVNDLIPFDAPIRFDDDHWGIVPAEASGWRPDIPILSEGILDNFAEIPNWQMWLTRGPDGVVVSLFSMP